ncbi:hypothetical protein A2215_03290 [Candidatus Berkelbacteria bacterium RIFOXYA2_FULL_43_10]|uniref:Uncharacterized protein n=1 Tax=Candidatus Berkelbacteria bacterium RIFOXYA2_FULL_43_10 TaxID=1797472 RepID=A0A1F5EE26_9BACT|nr:MAG: hypothetical protein A2215_03290 [Candidatus Berkelbacteria bacterium RIFOXYA2_FULL_43_10]
MDEGKEVGVDRGETQNYRAEISQLIHNAFHDRYNNLLRSIELGGLSMYGPTFRAARDDGMELSSEEEATLGRAENLETDIREGIKQSGITEDDRKRYASLTESSEATRNDVEFLKQYLDKVEVVYQSLLRKGYTDDHIRQ